MRVTHDPAAHDVRQEARDRHGQGGPTTVRRGLAIVMAGASGVGKGTIRAAAHEALKDVHFSVSATTRKRRPDETDGVQYRFLTRDAFRQMIQEDGLLEWAEYVGDLYGTPRAAVEETLAAGQDVLMEIDLAGARQVAKALPEAVMIFVAPPDLAELERRLRGRGTDPEEKIRKRLARAREELKALREFDYVIVNDRLPRAVADFEAVLLAERCRASRLTEAELTAFLREDSA